MKEAISYYGGNPNELDKRVVFEEEFNPTRMSLTAILYKETKTIERTNPDMVIMEGYGILGRMYEDKKFLVSLQYNSALDFRNKGIIGVRFITSRFPKEDIPSADFSDLIIQDRLLMIEDRLTHVYYILKPLAGEPFSCKGDRLDQCFEKLIPQLTGGPHVEI